MHTEEQTISFTMTRKSDSEKMLSRHSQGKTAAGSLSFDAAPKWGG